MITLVIGGSGSGKSEFAENLIMDLAGDNSKYYIATMQIYDAEGEKKAERHRRLRNGKGFATIEKARDIVAVDIPKGKQKEQYALLECLTNLVANEMFEGDCMHSATDTAGRILEEILSLSKKIEHLVIVSGNVFEDGISYDDATMEYMTALAMANEQLIQYADSAWEVVVGIPIKLK